MDTLGERKCSMSDSSVTELLVATITGLYHDVHEQLREAVAGAGAQALYWTPGPDTNSMGTLVVHMLESECEMLHSVRGLPAPRMRDAEFAPRSHTCDDLLSRIAAADRDLDELCAGITAGDLQDLRTRPNKPAAQSGLFWLLRNYGHAREHLAHLQLTKQLHDFAHRPTQ